MLICPDCAAPLESLETSGCSVCGWRLERRGGIPVLLSSADRESELFADYSANYDQIASDDLTETIQGDTYLRIQAERLLESLGTTDGLDVCDIGIGQGLLLDHLAASQAASVTGIDIAVPYLTKYADTERVRPVLANAENIPFDGEFDLMVASDVLEHVLNPADFLLTTHRALRADGRLVVKVPYKEDMTQYARTRGCSYEFVHLRNFTRDSLRSLLGHTGFEVERFVFDGFHNYRIRPILVRTRVTRAITNRLIARLFPTDTDLHRVGNRLGTMLLQPLELTAIAHKA